MKNTYWPEDTKDTMYLLSGTGMSITGILEKAKQKWGNDVSLCDIEIDAEHIHTDCLGYDSYDPSDWTNFVVVTYNPIQEN